MVYIVSIIYILLLIRISRAFKAKLKEVEDAHKEIEDLYRENMDKRDKNGKEMIELAQSILTAAQEGKMEGKTDDELHNLFNDSK